MLGNSSQRQLTSASLPLQKKNSKLASSLSFDRLHPFSQLQTGDPLFHKVFSVLSSLSVSAHKMWTSDSPCWPDGLRIATAIRRFTFGRAVLLAEVPDSLARRLHTDGEFADLSIVEVLSGLASAIRIALTITLVDERSRPLRYMSPGFDSPPSTQLDIPFRLLVSSSKEPRLTWGEHMAGGGIMTGHTIGLFLEECFQEAIVMVSRNLTLLHAQVPRHEAQFTFSQRCLASDCAFLQNLVNLDETVDVSASHQWQGKPRQRLALAVRDLLLGTPAGHVLPIEAWRFCGHLLAEKALRTQITSVKLSWKTVRSGLAAWSAFHAELLGGRFPQFPVSVDHICSFASIFSNADTLKAYIGHVRLASRLLRCPFASHATIDGLMRGVKKVTVHQPKEALVLKDVRRLVDHLLSEGHAEEARLCIIARCWLFRVTNELIPLQIDGRSNLAPSDSRWHSQLVFGASSITVSLRTRKNAPDGAVMTRTCLCKDRPRLMCGVCALRAQAESHTRSRLGETARLFRASSASALAIIRSSCLALGLPRVGWHSFRRGAARDMLNAGCSLAQILEAGGWRSAAFLRYLSRRDIDARVALELAEVASGSD